MELNGRKATWLELAVAPLWRLGRTRICIHRLNGGCDACLGITVDERWLCANDGRLTVFGTRDSALRFLELLRIDHVEDGLPVDLALQCGNPGVQCLRIGNRGLRNCEGPAGKVKRPEGTPRIRVRPSRRQAGFSSEFEP